MTVRVAVLGAGRRGTMHTEAVGDLEGLAQVVGVADTDAARARTLVGTSAEEGARLCWAAIHGATSLDLHGMTATEGADERARTLSRAVVGGDVYGMTPEELAQAYGRTIGVQNLSP